MANIRQATRSRMGAERSVNPVDSYDEAQLDGTGRAVLGLATLILALSLIQAVYRLSLPSDGWTLAFDLGDNEELFRFDQNLSGAPSPLHTGDVLVAVDGQPVGAMVTAAFTLHPQRPANWAVGQTVRYTVLREARQLTLDVPIGLRPVWLILSYVGMTFLMNPSLVPALLIGFFVFFRCPRKRTAQLLLLLTVCFFAADGVSQSVTGVHAGPADLFYRGAYWPAQFFNRLIWALVIGPIYMHLFLTFPVVKKPIHFHPHLTLAGLYGFMPVLMLVVLVLNLGRPLAFWRTWSALASFEYLIVVLTVALATGHTLVTVRDATQRAQIRWVAWGILITSIGVLVGFLLGKLDLIGRYPLFGLAAYRLPMLAFPLSLAIAILRYRLFDIDVIINRTLVYAALTAVLASIYFGSIVALEYAFHALTKQSSDLAVVTSTLGIAALFNPLRRRVQDFVDWRLYRSRYDAAKTLAAFGVTLRDEVDLTKLTERLEAVIGETIQPAHVLTWLRTPSGFALHLFGREDSAQGWGDTTPADAQISASDPIVAYFRSASGAVELDRLNLDSPALHRLKAGGVKIALPLISQGELVGWLSLGPRLSAQGYSLDDRTLLNNLASQAAPAVRVAQLARQEEIEARERERLEQELRVARLIQQTLLPQELPSLPGWQVAAYWQPARAIGGDFYDFMPLPDGRLVFVVADVADKGVPAALVMASTRAILRGTARRLLSPSAALALANNLLYPEIPSNMFVTCLYAILDPISGQLQYANAGHNLPYRRSNGNVVVLWATGMPLGMMPGSFYQEEETTIQPGENLLLYSDGLVEAHNSRREMFGFPRLKAFMGNYAWDGPALIESLLAELRRFTGEEWEQEDDVTLVTLQRSEARR